MVGIASLRPRQWSRLCLTQLIVTSPPYLHLPSQTYASGTRNRPMQLEFRPYQSIGQCYSCSAQPFRSLLQSPHRRHPAMEGTDTHLALRFDRRMPDGDSRSTPPLAVGLLDVG